MSSTLQAIAGFEDLVGKYKIAPTKSCETILTAIDKVLATKPAAYHQNHITAFLNDRAKVLNSLANDYLKVAIGQKYPYLDPAIWNLKRNLHLKLTSDGVIAVKDETESVEAAKDITVITMPLFAWTVISDKHTACQLYKQGVWFSGSSSKRAVEISAEMPSIPLHGMLGGNLRKAYRTALSDAYKIASDLLSREGIGDVLSENLDNLKADIIVTWIPTLPSLKIKHEVVQEPVKYDPAMLIRMRGHCFLVALWQVDDELPLEHFMREYTHGSLEKVVKE